MAIFEEPMDLTKAGARVTLTSYDDPGEEMHDAILNPASLPINVEVAVGELHPVGASNTTLQYGHTKSLTSTLELYFSTQLQGRFRSDGHDQPGRTAIAPVDIMQYVNWLAAFCFGKEAGRAPSPLLILWPNVLNIIVVVRSFRTEYIRFARDLTPTAARVSLECTELRFSHKTSDEQRKDGWTKQDPLLESGATGRPMNLKPKGR